MSLKDLDVSVALLSTCLGVGPISVYKYRCIYRSVYHCKFVFVYNNVLCRYKLTALKFKCHYRNTSILFPFKLCTKKIVRKHARLYLNGGKITNVNDTHA